MNATFLCSDNDLLCYVYVKKLKEWSCMNTSYNEVMNKLYNNVACVVFKKSNGKIRVMLCTRSYTVEALCGSAYLGITSKLEGRCTETNGNIAVLDLEALDARSINVDRLLFIVYFPVTNKQQLDGVFMAYLNNKNELQARYSVNDILNTHMGV